MSDAGLRILMVAPTPYFADRGCHVRIYEEARALIARGHQVRIVTYHLGRTLPDIPTERIPVVPWYRKLAAGPSWHKPYLDLLLLVKAYAVARRFRPQLLYAHLHEGAFLGIVLKAVLRRPLLFDCQGSLTAELVDHGFVRPGSLLFRLFRAIERFVNGRVDYLVTSSGPAAQALSTVWGVPVDRVSALMDGVDMAEFRPLPKESIRQELALPRDVPVAVFLGVLNSYQGIDLLLEVMALLKSRGVPIHFLVMGFPEESYRRRAEAAGLAGQVTFTGRIDYRQAARYLAAGDVALSPKVSLTEANGKLFNYMACGLPVVAFDTPVNREILGETGIYARFNDPEDFAGRLAELITADPAVRRELAGRVRHRAEQEHSWRVRGEQLSDICCRVVAGSGSR